MENVGDDILQDTTESTTVDTILLKFTTALQNAIDKYIPVRMSKTKEKTKHGSNLKQKD